MAIDVREMNARLQQFRHDYCGKLIEADVPLRFVSDMFWALGLPAPTIRLTPLARPMVWGDIFPEPQHD